MKETLNQREQRLIKEGFRFNIHGELSMPADEFIKRWEQQHPLRSHFDEEKEWWVTSRK